MMKTMIYEDDEKMMINAVPAGHGGSGESNVTHTEGSPCN